LKTSSESALENVAPTRSDLQRRESAGADVAVAGGVEASSERVDYIRGAAGANISSRGVARVLAGSMVVLLAILGIILTAQAAGQTARDHRLQQRGVPVEVRVTHCVGRASGTGVTDTGFTCTGTFDLDGRRYSDVIGGTTILRSPGDTLSAVTDPHHPAILTTAAAVATAPASWKSFIAPAVVFLMLLLSAGYTWRRFRRPGMPATDIVLPSGSDLRTPAHT
jgi:hypothetical protein